MLVGRLDEGAGFDSARERFRRYLLERVVDVRALHALIDQCQHVPGDQHYRALQDLVVLLGRCLGFEVRFGNRLPALRAAGHDGQWHSRLHLEVDVDVDQPSGPTPVGEGGRSLAISVITPLHAGRSHLDRTSPDEEPHAPRRPVSLRSLLAFADMIAAGRLSHEDFVRLIRSGVALDFVIDLLEGATKPAEAPTLLTMPLGRQPGFWIAVIGTDQAATPEQFVELVIARRRILGVGNGEAPRDAAQPGDRVCFYIPRTGVVGHARIDSTVTDRSAGIRDAHRFSQVLHLDAPVLHMDHPSAIGDETLLRLRAAGASSHGAVHALTRISREEFTGLLSEETEATAELPISAEGLRSRA